MEMAASLGAREQALHRAQAELEVANIRTIAEMHSLARAREAEQRETAEAQRHREAAAEALRMPMWLRQRQKGSNRGEPGSSSEISFSSWCSCWGA